MLHFSGRPTQASAVQSTLKLKLRKYSNTDFEFKMSGSNTSKVKSLTLSFFRRSCNTVQCDSGLADDAAMRRNKTGRNIGQHTCFNDADAG